ncbi:MAG: rRNA maturation RNase YbeY [Bacillota bacterium]
MPLFVSNQQDKVRVTAEQKRWLGKVAVEVFLAERVTPEAEVALLLVDDERIRELNCTYRGVDAPTDVLSFAMGEQTDEEPEILDAEEEIILGDIVISVERAVQQAQEYGHSIEREIGYLLVHGFLHLLGYDHQEEEEQRRMRTREEGIMDAVKLNR